MKKQQRINEVSLEQLKQLGHRPYFKEKKQQFETDVNCISSAKDVNTFFDKNK